MALHDVSRGDSKRIKRILTNAPDTIPGDLRMAHGTTQINYAQSGESTSGYGIKFGNGKIEVVDSAGNTVGRIGFDDTDADNKIKVSRPGTSL